MSFHLTVLYKSPSPADSSVTGGGEKPKKFDLDYYTTKHMPMVASVYRPYGLQSWHVCTLNPDSGFSVLGTMIWESRAAYESPPKEATDALLSDVKNYSDSPPIFIEGDVVCRQE